MNARWMLSTSLVLAGQLAVGSLAAAPLGGAGAASDALGRNGLHPLIVEVQNPVTHRMSRLWQNRSIIENALRAPTEEEVFEAEPPEPEPLAETEEAALEPEPEEPEALEPEPEQLEAAEPEPEPEAEPEPEEQVAAQEDDRLSCDAAAEIIEDYGFSDVRSASCAGEVYEFSATRDGTSYSIGIAAASGELAEVKRE